MAQYETKQIEGIALSPLGVQVYELLKAYTSFAGAVLTTHAKRLNVDLAKLKASDLAQLAKPISFAVAQFSTPEKGEALLAALNQLSR
jgi:hypothetical protein